MNQPGAPEPALSLSKGLAFFETWEDCLGAPPAPGEVDSPTERMECSPAEAPRDDNFPTVRRRAYPGLERRETWATRLLFVKGENTAKSSLITNLDHLHCFYGSFPQARRLTTTVSGLG